jgi:hypothetical protein
VSDLPEDGDRPRLDPRRLVYRWDLDKTYLRTEFDTLGDLFRTALESASDKRTVPGAPALLRELRATAPLGIYIVSGSPEQLRGVLEAKLRLDGIRWDGFVLKPQLHSLLRGRFRNLRDQVGYKLGVLLESRATMPRDVDEFLFGDDAEADAFIYSIYSDLSAGRVGPEVLSAVLRRAGVYDADLPRLVSLAQRLPRKDGTRRIFIHLDRVSSPAVFAEFGQRVCPFYNYFQPALVLHDEGALDVGGVLRVGAELIVSHAFTGDALAASYRDLVLRGHLDPRRGEELVEACATLEDSHFPTTAPTLQVFGEELAELLGSCEPPPVTARPSIDYVGLFSRDKDRARRARRRSRR